MQIRLSSHQLTYLPIGPHFLVHVRSSFKRPLYNFKNYFSMTLYTLEVQNVFFLGICFSTEVLYGKCTHIGLSFRSSHKSPIKLIKVARMTGYFLYGKFVFSAEFRIDFARCVVKLRPLLYPNVAPAFRLRGAVCVRSFVHRREHMLRLLSRVLS